MEPSPSFKERNKFSSSSMNLFIQEEIITNTVSAMKLSVTLDTRSSELIHAGEKPHEFLQEKFHTSKKQIATQTASCKSKMWFSLVTVS